MNDEPSVSTVAIGLILLIVVATQKALLVQDLGNLSNLMVFLQS